MNIKEFDYLEIALNELENDNINTIEQWFKNSDAILLHLHNEILEVLD